MEDFKEYMTIKECNGFLFVRWNVEFITLKIATETVKIRTEATQGKDFFVLSDARKLKAITREARKHLAEHIASGVKGGAVLVDSIESKMVAKFFLEINKPKVKFKIFDCEKVALTWLKMQK